MIPETDTREALPLAASDTAPQSTSWSAYQCGEWHENRRTNWWHQSALERDGCGEEQRFQCWAVESLADLDLYRADGLQTTGEFAVHDASAAVGLSGDATNCIDSLLFAYARLCRLPSMIVRRLPSPKSATVGR